MRGRARIIGAAAIALVVCLLFYMFFIRPRQAKVGEVNDKILAAESETQALTLELDRLEGLKENAPELNATLERIRGFVPKEGELPNFIFQVEQAADEAGVSFVTITPELPKPPPTAISLAEIRVTIDATGGFFSLQDFIRRLYALDRAMRIDTLALSSDASGGGGETTTTTTDGEEGDLTLSIAGRIFFELPEGVAAVPPAGTPPEPAPTEGTAPTTEETAPPADPGATETTAPEETAPAP